jgi:hypothetical protein
VSLEGLLRPFSMQGGVFPPAKINCVQGTDVISQQKRRMACPQVHVHCTVLSESRRALRLRYVDLVVSIKVAVAVCCCFTVFSCQTAVEVQYR